MTSGDRHHKDLISVLRSPWSEERQLHRLHHTTVVASAMVVRHLVLLLGFISWVTGYKDYSDRIPNGVRVPHPCKDNYLWHGVGHMNSQGGGSRNVFGVAFQKAGHVWTRELCQADSDGDGKTNGEELGDPRCVWTPGTTPERTVSITHPGICQPLGSEECQNKPVPVTPGEVYKFQRDWIADACKSDEFVCEQLNTTADVRRMELRIPLTPVPAKETTYMCSFFDFENDTADFHIIAATPIINNSYVMHHMLLFGCPEGFTKEGHEVKQPFECNMGGCDDIIGIWTLGLNGQCFHPQAGFKVGATGYKRMMIQYHWNNPLLRSDFVDASGLTLYYTPNLRPHNLATLMTGQYYLEIPPYTDLTIATSDCTATCTRNLLQGDINVVNALNHMHYLGKSMYLEHHRDGQMLTYLAQDPAYNYDNPTFYQFQEPVVVKPGDVVRTTCHFKSTDKPFTTFEGEGTSDEMCYGFVSFYPAENLPTTKQCVSAYKNLIDCDPETTLGCDGEERGKFWLTLNTTSLYHNITTVCKPFGVCSQECKAAFSRAVEREPCMKNRDAWEFVKYQLLARHDTGRTLLASVLPCEVSIYKDSHSDGVACTEAAVDETSRAETPEMTLLLLALLVPLSCLWSWS